MSTTTRAPGAAGVASTSVTPEVKAALDDFMNAFEHFKSSNRAFLGGNNFSHFEFRQYVHATSIHKHTRYRP